MREKNNRMKLKHLFLTVVSLFVFAVAELPAQTKGNATYYGNKFHGRRTSDGSRYHRDSLTCAHRTLPFGTYLKVRNPKNDREVVVKVTDRGPFRRGCIVDLSRAAAEQLDMIASGVVPVEVELVEPVVPFRNIENTILPSLDFDNAAGKEYFSLAQDNPRMEKRLKDKTASIGANGIKSNGTKTKAEEPRYRIRRDILSAQSK